MRKVEFILLTDGWNNLLSWRVFRRQIRWRMVPSLWWIFRPFASIIRKLYLSNKSAIRTIRTHQHWPPSICIIYRPLFRKAYCLKPINWNSQNRIRNGLICDGFLLWRLMEPMPVILMMPFGPNRIHRPIIRADTILWSVLRMYLGLFGRRPIWILRLACAVIPFISRIGLFPCYPKPYQMICAH